MRRKSTPYFKRREGTPEPIVVEVKRRVHFSEVDGMGIVWYGRYTAYIEEGAEEIGRHCGLSYQDFFKAKLRAPIVTFHIDFYKPLHLGEEFTIRAVLVWDEGSRLNTEYYLLQQDGSVTASGYTVQLLTDADSGEVVIVSPPLLEESRRRWKSGAFHCQK
jgi:acyl-CoA thioester hydrolase